MLKDREYHVLDKDLSKLGHAEGAGRVAGRPLRRFGLILWVVGLLALLAAFAGADVPSQGTMIAGLAVAMYLGLNMGANDVANSAGAAIGARALPIGLGLAAVAAAELCGALLAGSAVTRTIAEEIIAPAQGTGAGRELASVMACALVGAGLWITLANWARAPVSTTHSIVGAVAGAGMAAMGVTAVNWAMIGQIALGWVFAPLAAALMAAGILGFLRWRVHFAEDSVKAARLWLPLLIAVTVTVFALYVARLANRGGLTPAWLGLCVTLGIVSHLLSRWHLDRQLIRHRNRSVALKNILAGPLVVTVLLSGFAHGANDVGNVAGPLTVLLAGTEAEDMPRWIIGMAGISVAAGSLIFGRRLVRMVGSSITRLNPVRAFCAALAGAATVLGCSALGLPVSTTHCAVGGIFGVGFYREWEDRLRRKTRKALPVEEMHRRRLVRRSHVWTTLAAWAVTVPGAGMMAAGVFGLLSMVR
ncbi:inorganic phosphate transporter [Paracoccus isoporae]|nr:inorganic phosphate transporter [Paracoccus isoporae]